MIDNKIKDGMDSDADLLQKAIDEGDADKIEQILCNTDDDADVESTLRKTWNEPMPEVNRKTVEASFASFKRRVRSSRNNSRPLLWSTLIGAVATVVLAVMLWDNSNQSPMQPEVINTQWEECYTHYGQMRELTLADGTHLWVNAGSHVLYPKEFHGNERHIYMSGEIYLDVARDEQKPFIVSANGAEIKVLGTSFNVKSYINEEEMSTTLTSGAIELRMPGSPSVYNITPGKTLVWNRTSGDVSLFSIDNYAYPSWFRGEFNVYNKTFEEITGELERRFDVKIIIRNPALNNISFYASFVNNESVDQILQALNIKRQFRIVRKNNVIDIY